MTDTPTAIDRERVMAMLQELEADERLTKYRTASAFSNVVLALHQAHGRAQIIILRNLLELPPFQFPKGDPL
jgi:hypothetical protein